MLPLCTLTFVPLLRPSQARLSVVMSLHDILQSCFRCALLYLFYYFAHTPGHKSITVTLVTSDYRLRHNYFGTLFHSSRHYSSCSTPINHTTILISMTRHTEYRCLVEYTPRILLLTRCNPSPLRHTRHMVHCSTTWSTLLMYSFHTCYTTSPLRHTRRMVHHSTTWSTFHIYSLHTHYATSSLWHTRHMVHHSTT